VDQAQHRVTNFEHRDSFFLVKSDKECAQIEFDIRFIPVLYYLYENRSIVTGFII